MVAYGKCKWGLTPTSLSYPPLHSARARVAATAITFTTLACQFLQLPLKYWVQLTTIPIKLNINLWRKFYQTIHLLKNVNNLVVFSI